MDEFKPRKFVAIVDEFGLDDFGYSGQTFQVRSIEKGKIYTERNPEFIEGHKRGVVIDDNSCWHFVGTKEFNKRFTEVHENHIS